MLKRGRPLSPFDVVGLAFAILGLAWAIAAAFFVAPTYAATFSILCCGSPADSCLPALTVPWLSPWTNLAFGLVPFAIAVLPWAHRARRRARAVAMIGAIMWVVAQPVVFFAVMYLPLISCSQAML